MSDALALIANTATAERGLASLRTVKGRSEVSLALARPEAMALAVIARTGIAVTRAIPALEDAADAEAAQRGLDQLRGAMRSA